MNLSAELQSVQAALDNLRRLQRKTELIAAVIVGSSIGLAIWILGIAVETIWHLSSPGRWLVLIILGLCSFIVLFLLRRRLTSDKRLRVGLESEEYWALEVGRFAAETIRDRLLNALQVNRRRENARDPQSEELARLALLQAAAELPAVDAEQVVDRRSFKLAAYPTSGTVILTVILLILFSNPFYLAAGRLFSPNVEYTAPPPFILSVEPAGGWGYRNEPVVFNIQALGAAPSEAGFYYRYAGGETQTEVVRLTDGKGSLSFSGFPNTFFYSIRRDEVKTPEYKFEVVIRPQVAELHYKVHPPRYTGRPTVVGRENVGDVEALPGSTLELKVRANKPLAEAWMQYLAAGLDSSRLDSLPMKAQGNSAEIQLRLQREGSYAVRLVDKDGHPDIDPVRYNIRLLIDETPSVRIVFPEGDVVLGEDMILPLAVEADDDYGLGKIVLEYQNLADSIVSTLTLPLKTVNARSVNVEYLWQLGSLALMPGDVLEYWAATYDNDDVRGPKRAASERRLVRLPTFEEIVASVEQSEETAFEKTEKTLDAAKQLRDEVARLAEEMKRNPNIDWQRRKQMDEAVAQQKDLNAQVEQARNALDELVDRLEKNDMLTAATLEKYQELQKLLSEVATPELKAAMEKLKAALESQDPEQIRQALEQFDQNREQFLQNIERSLNILKQLQLERKLDELARRAEELLHAQEHSLKAMEEGQIQDIPLAQEMMAQAMESLSESMCEAAKMAATAGEKELAETLDSLQIAMTQKDLTNRLRQTGADAACGDINAAQEKGRQSARDLAELQNTLKRAAADLKERHKKDLAKKLRRLTEELLIISEAQEDVIRESRELGTQSPRYRDLSGRQGDVRAALQGVTERTFDLARETFFITPQLGAALGKAIQETDNSISAYTERSPRSALTSQKRTLGEINRSAAELLSILNQLEGSQSSTGFDEMMQKLSEMASAQQGLNQQSMPIPGPGGEESALSGESMARLAAQQRALQQAMEQAAAEAQGMKEILGNLEGIAETMGEVAQDFEHQQVDERTRRLQRQIVNRLLDATRSAREQEYSKKRESRSGIDIARKPPTSMKMNLEREKLRRDLLRALQEGYTPDYRRLIREYFNALEQTNKQP